MVRVLTKEEDMAIMLSFYLKKNLQDFKPFSLAMIIQQLVEYAKSFGRIDIYFKYCTFQNDTVMYKCCCM